MFSLVLDMEENISKLYNLKELHDDVDPYEIDCRWRYILAKAAIESAFNPANFFTSICIFWQDGRQPTLEIRAPFTGHVL